MAQMNEVQAAQTRPFYVPFACFAVSEETDVKKRANIKDS